MLAFVATGCEAADAALRAEARQAGAVVNVIDRPDMCDAFTPSIVDRDPVVVAIGTEGTAPVLGRAIRSEIEQMLSPGSSFAICLISSFSNSLMEKPTRLCISIHSA
ncbi:precorrin-2 dehydrogenase/sirohydrochlorin ferrochelatase family protein [Mangrovicoccus ximenensis]|uniref:precorrin-2 dehydrogenase/sirohydrochlorin ferrochelatase family protein n=1 Tax=Mangrovicoccus ximenensis TaxID=1911570 RepID=UPI000D36660E